MIPVPSSEMVMFLACCGGLAISAQLARMRMEDHLLLLLASLVRAVAVVMFVAGVAQWLVGVPFSVAFEGLRVALNTSLTTISGAPITPMTLISVITIFGGSWWMSAWVRRAMERMLLGQKIGDPGSVAALARLVQYLVMGTGFAIGLETLGIDLGAFFAAGAVFAVGIGFAMQTIAENFVSGVILLAERTIRPGDILEVNGEMVRVINLGIRSTLARTNDDEEIIIPNADLVKNPVKNLKLSDSLLRVRVPVGVAYESDLPEVMRVLRACAESVPSTDKRAPVVQLKGFGASSIDFEVSVWTEDPWMRPAVGSELAMAIWAALKQANITIAFPQLDVHFDPPTRTERPVSLP
ncbi:MAG: mechanosensitive ion channel [Myxococcales bacterium]|nr:mechanosensitive ion channel [Myxococcales bacterium]MCB9668839.1 mechanosensitive ion channel [Alphaproteobacteria bacterium]MCB9691156.1 mechanosensitive ion channel [Alphaproteobacteria bacterium]